MTVYQCARGLEISVISLLLYIMQLYIYNPHLGIMDVSDHWRLFSYFLHLKQEKQAGETLRRL